MEPLPQNWLQRCSVTQYTRHNVNLNDLNIFLHIQVQTGITYSRYPQKREVNEANLHMLDFEGLRSICWCEDTKHGLDAGVAVALIAPLWI